MNRLNNVNPEDILRAAGQLPPVSRAAAAAAYFDDESSTQEESDYDDMPPLECRSDTDSTSHSHTSLLGVNLYDEEPTEVPPDYEAAYEDSEADDEVLEDQLFTPLPPLSNLRFRNWFITYFAETWTPNFSNWHLVQFAVLTKEVCPSTNRTHYHAYVEFTNPVSMSSILKKLDCPTAHCRPRKGTQRQCITYVTKKRTRFPGFELQFYGEFKQQGQRSDLDWIVEAIKQGATKRELLQIGGGNVLRYMNMISMAQRVFNFDDDVDIATMARRQAASAGGVDVDVTIGPTIAEIRKKEGYRENLRNDVALAISDNDRPLQLQRALAMVAASDLAKEEKKNKLKQQKAAAKQEQTAVKKVAKLKNPVQTIRNKYKKYSIVNIKRAVNEALEQLPQYMDYSLANGHFLESIQPGLRARDYVDALRKYVLLYIDDYCRNRFDPSLTLTQAKIEEGLVDHDVHKIAVQIYDDMYKDFFACLEEKPSP